MKVLDRSRVSRLLSAGLLVCFVFTLAQASLPHTDDGCAVELHCFACRWAFAGASLAVALPPPDPTLETSGIVGAQIVPIRFEAAAATATSRAPPSA